MRNLHAKKRQRHKDNVSQTCKCGTQHLGYKMKEIKQVTRPSTLKHNIENPSVSFQPLTDVSETFENSFSFVSIQFYQFEIRDFRHCSVNLMPRTVTLM